MEKYDLGPALSKTSEWPLEGKVEFQSYAASYSPGILPDVLKGITFTVNPSEKVRPASSRAEKKNQDDLHHDLSPDLHRTGFTIMI